MSDTAYPEPENGAASLLRWGLSLAVVAGLHVGAAVLLLRSGVVIELPPPAPEAVLMELPAPEPAAPPEAPPAAEPPPPQPAPAPEPPPPPPPPEPPPPEPPPPEAPPAAEPPPPEPPPPVVASPPPVPMPPPPPPPPPEPVKPPRPKPPPRPLVRPPPRPLPQRVEEAAPMPAAPAPAPVMPRIAPAPAAPQAAAPAPPSNAVLSWRGQISARLARAKRYPEQARARGEQGTVMAVFTVDRNGRVLSASVTRSSGSIMLDDEAVAAIRRADLPPMPPEMTESTITFPVPFKFDLH